MKEDRLEAGRLGADIDHADAVTMPRAANSVNAMSMVCMPSFWLACMMPGI